MTDASRRQDDPLDDAYERGAYAWGCGAPMQPMPADDASLEDQAFYLGYIMARARDYFRRRDMALYPDTVEFRP